MKRTRVFSFLLALVMIIALLPVSALAVTTISNVTVNFPAPAYGEEINAGNMSPVLSFGSDDGKIIAEVGDWLYNGNPLGTPMYSNFGFPSRINCTAILNPASGYQFTSSTTVEIHDTNYGIEGDPAMLYCDKEYQSDGTLKLTIHLYFPDRYRNDFHERLRVRELPLGITQLPQVGWHKSDAETYSEVYVKNSSDYYAFATTPPPAGYAWREFGRFNDGLPEEAYPSYDTIKPGMLLYTWLDIELDGDGGWWRLGVQNFTFPDLSAAQQQGLSARIAYLDLMEGQNPPSTMDLTRARVYIFYRVPGATHIDQIDMTFDDFKPIDNPDASSGYQLSENNLILPNFEITNSVHCSMSPEYLETYDWYGFTEGPEGYCYPEGDYTVTLCLDVEDGYYIDENTVINIIGRHGQPADVDYSKAQYGYASFNVTYHARDYAALEITEEPWDDYVDLGETISATVIAHGVGLKYQWYFKDPGASSFTKSSNTTNTYSTTMTEAKNGRQVYCIVKDSSGNSVKTRTATLRANIPLSITTQPMSATVAAGGTAKFSVSATGATSYQWYYRKSATGTWLTVKEDDAKTTQITVMGTAANNGYQYRCKVMNDEEYIYSVTVTLKVKPKITVQPTDKTVAVGATTSFAVTAQNATSYQWYYRKSATGTWLTVKEDDAKTTQITVMGTAANNGYQYRCKVMNDSGFVYTNTVNLTVVNKPTITTQPTDKTVVYGATAVFSVTAENATSYQWYYRKSSTGTWLTVKEADAKTAHITVASAGKNGYQYRCKVMNANGYVYTNTVTLKVKPKVTTQPTNMTIAVGATASFAVTAQSATGYQWYYRKSSTGTWLTVKEADATTPEITVTGTAANNGYQYRCKVTNSAGYVYTDTVTLKVKPKITTQPKSKTVTSGTSAVFKVTATNATSYQWYYRKSSTGTWLTVKESDATTAQITVASAGKNGYQYRCKVSNATSYVYTSIVTLNVT